MDCARHQPMSCLAEASLTMAKAEGKMGPDCLAPSLWQSGRPLRA